MEIKKKFPSELLVPELIPCENGMKWRVVADVAPSVTDIAALRPVPALEPGDSSGWRNDEIPRKHHRFKLLYGHRGLADAKRILGEQEKLSPEFSEYYHILLLGTLLRDNEYCDPGDIGNLRFPVLDRRGGRLHLEFGYWSDHFLSSIHCFTRIR